MRDQAADRANFRKHVLSHSLSIWGSAPTLTNFEHHWLRFTSLVFSYLLLDTTVADILSILNVARRETQLYATLHTVYSHWTGINLDHYWTGASSVCDQLGQAAGNWTSLKYFEIIMQLVLTGTIWSHGGDITSTGRNGRHGPRLYDIAKSFNCKLTQYKTNIRAI